MGFEHTGVGRLPFLSSLPAWQREIVVAAFMIAAAFGLRSIVELLATNVVPFALIFPAIAGATLLASWRAGIAVLVICQLWAWYFFLPEVRTFRIATTGDGISLLLTTLAQLVLLWAMSRYAAVYQRLSAAEGKRAAAEAARAEHFRLALRELDHRTMNNFQLAAVVLRAQQRQQTSTEAYDALDASAQRLMVLAALHRKLSYDITELEKRPLAPLIEEVVESLRGHIVDDGVSITTDLDVVDVTHDRALHLALIVNELVTNSLKHAFPEGRGRVLVAVKVDDGSITLRVSDDGIGLSNSAEEGTGHKLTDMLAKSVGGEIRTGSGPGTSNTLTIARH